MRLVLPDRGAIWSPITEDEATFNFLATIDRDPPGREGQAVGPGGDVET